MNEKLKDTHLETWRLFITTHARLINTIDAQMQAEKQIPLHWYDVLIELYEAPQHRLRMSDLADKVVLSRSGLTRLVDKLEQAGYLLREIDPDDRRGFYAILTDTGKEAMRGAWSSYAKGIETHFAQYLSDDDAAQFTRFLSRIIDNL